MDINKLIAKLPAGFAEEAAGLDADGLRTEVIRAETALHETKKALKADEKLTAAREVVKDLSGAYNDAKKAQRAKIDYVMLLLEERGELGTGEFNPDGDAVSHERIETKTAVRKKKAA